MLLLMAVALQAAPGSSTRSGPDLYSAGQTITVTNLLAPLATVGVQTLTESVPSGWSLVDAGGGSWDGGTRTVRWLYFDGLVREITIRIKASDNPGATATFSGEASFDGQVVAVTGLAQASLRPPPSGTVSRTLPASYRPGVAFTVSVTATPDSGLGSYGLTDTFPSGWTVSTPSHYGNVQGSQVRWGPFLDDTARTFTYTLTPPAGATGVASFSGSASFDSADVSTTGGTSMSRQPDPSGTIGRQLPGVYHSAEAFTVTLTVTPEPTVTAYAVVETPPTGWTIAGISHYGTSEGGATVRWGPFLDSAARTLTYQVTPPAGVGGTRTFSGVADFDGTSVTATGATQVAWASLEDGTMTRSLPDTCERGVAVAITNSVVPNDQVTAYGVEEFLPAGWTLGEIGLASYQASTHSLRWGPFLDGDARDLVYELVPPADASGTVTLTGMATFGATVVGSGGASNLTVRLPTGGTASRTVAAMFRPGDLVDVALRVAPNEGTGLYIVDEILPVGWTATNANAGGAFDSATRRLRWGPFTDAAARDLTYQAVTPSSARGTSTLEGTAYFDGGGVAVGGQSNLLANAAPELTSLPEVNTFEDGPVVITFNATDDLTADKDLQLTATSSDTAFLPNASLILGRIGGAHSLRINLPPETAGQSTITVTVSDGTYQAESSFLLTISLTNDIPRLLVPPGGPMTEDTPLTITDFQVVDPDAAGGQLDVVLQANHGTVAVASLNGITVVEGADGSASMKLRGTLGDLNTALASVVLRPDLNFNGTLWLDAAVDDRGNSGGAAQSESHRIEFAVAPVNDPPVPGEVVVTARAGRSTKFLASKVLGVASDVEDDALRVSGVTSPSANGASVRMAGTWIVYEPPADGVLPDTISYTLSDGNSTVTGTLRVELAPDPNEPGANIVRLQVLPNTDVQITFAGVPGRTYRIQACSDLASRTWQALGTVTADRYGRYQFTETAGSLHSVRYYRSLTP